MEEANVVRIVFVVFALVVAGISYLVKKFMLKDRFVEEKVTETMTNDEGKLVTVDKTKKSIEKQNYERIISDAIFTMIIYYFIIFGVIQIWQLVEFNPLFGTIGIGFLSFLPLVVVGGFITGFLNQTNLFKKMMIWYAEPETKKLSVDEAEYFTNNGVRYLKAESIKEAINENFTRVDINAFNDLVWRGLLNGEECEPIFADKIKQNEDSIEITTYSCEGGIITTELAKSATEEELFEKAVLKEIIKEMAAQLKDVSKAYTLLVNEQEKHIQDEVAERLAAFLALFGEGACTILTEEEIRKMKDKLLKKTAVLEKVVKS